MTLTIRSSRTTTPICADGACSRRPFPPSSGAIPVWRWRHEHAPVDGLLRRLAADELILATSGGSDWLTGSGRAEKVEGGYRVTARKIFASGSPAADLL